MKEYDNYLAQQVDKHLSDCIPHIPDEETGALNCIECEQKDCEYWSDWNE